MKMKQFQLDSTRKVNTKPYSNGQLGVFVHDKSGEPIAELSVMENSVELEPNEIILKDYSENTDLAQELINSEIILPTERFILVGSRLCPICKVSDGVLT